MTVTDNKVLVCSLWQRTSERGNEYLSGFLGKARIIGFRGEPRPDGTPTWNLYLQPGKEQEEAADREPRRARPRPQKAERPAEAPDGEPFYNDDIPDMTP